MSSRRPPSPFQASTSKGSSSKGGDGEQQATSISGYGRLNKQTLACSPCPVPCFYPDAGGVGGRDFQGRRSYCKKDCRNIAWADEVGRIFTEEEPICNKLTEEEPFCKERETCSKINSRCPGDVAAKVHQEDCFVVSADTKGVQEGFVPGWSDHLSPPRRESYKEVLLRPGVRHLRHTPTSQGSRARKKEGRRLTLPKRAVRCFRCLALGYLALACRDPVRCRSCWKFGHKAVQCKELPARRVDGDTMNQLRAHHQRERTHRLKAFVPLTEEYLRRVELRQNAVLADIIQPADLGNAPQQTITNALASRFGGYPHDFFVTRHRERAFAIILPRWVSAETLTRRQVITLEAFWLRCFVWGAERNARPHRLGFTAWIQLRNLPFECWTAARVASMVGGFGRFLRADETTKNMIDLRVYRCWIAVDNVGEIPRRLSIVVGDEVVDISIFLESSERIRGGNVDPPPQPPAPHPDAPNDSPRRGPRRDGDGDARSIVGGVGEGPSAWGVEPAAGLLSTCSVNRRTAARVSGPPTRAGRSPPSSWRNCPRASSASILGGPGVGVEVVPGPPCLDAIRGNDLGARACKALMVGDSASACSRLGWRCDDRWSPRIGGGNRMPPGGGTGSRRVDRSLLPTLCGPTGPYEVARASSEQQARCVVNAAPEEDRGAITMYGVATDRGKVGAGRCVRSLVKSGCTVVVGDSNRTSRFLSSGGWVLGGVALAGWLMGPTPKLERCCTGWAGGVSLTLLTSCELGPSCGFRDLRLRVPWGVGLSLDNLGLSCGRGFVGISLSRSGAPLTARVGVLRAMAQDPTARGWGEVQGAERGFDDGPGHGDVSSPIVFATVAISGSAAPEVAGLPSSGRYSQRLASRDTTPMLTKAMARKARLQGCEVDLASARDKSRVARFQKKSKLCGVTLDRVEANSLLEFEALKNV